MGRRRPDTLLTHQREFDALPETVQKKYFSELERLRIADGAQNVRPHIAAPRPAHHVSNALHRSLTLGSARKRLRKSEAIRQQQSISQQEAQWFLSLPDKVRRRHFSREEQVLLAGRFDHPYDQVLKRSLDNFEFNFYDSPAVSLDASSPARGRSRRRSSSISPDQDDYPFGIAELEASPLPNESIIHLDRMSPPPPPPAAPQMPVVPPTRRTLSLTNIPFRTSTSSSPVLASPPIFSLNTQPWRQRSRASSLVSQSGRRSSHMPAAPVFDPEATHYQDPEARKKLRMYLASPQKFDEAVEFGFPATAGKDETLDRASPQRSSFQLPPIRTHARKFSKDMHTFLRDDRVSYLEDSEDDRHVHDSDGDSMTDLDSPVTPSSTGLSFRYHGRHDSNFSSMDSNGLPPPHPMTGRFNREMTLRMTLTRPDLRADEDQLYGWQANRGEKDPFALEELPISDDMTGAKGAFAIRPKPQGNLVTRLFKRASMAKKGQR